MSSRREDIILAVVALITAALPGADVKRNRTELTRVGPGGAVSVMDGDPGDPEMDLGLGEPIYNYSHRLPVIFAAGDSASVDMLQQAVGEAVRADRTLGGLAEYMRPEAPDGEALDVAGASPSAQSEAALIVDYATKSPL